MRKWIERQAFVGETAILLLSYSEGWEVREVRGLEENSQTFKNLSDANEHYQESLELIKLEIDFR